jgi:amino acid adenylation domain-containing protein
MNNKLSITHKKSCIVIGSTGLCVSVLKRLIAKEWRIIFIVSTDPMVKEYCRSNQLEVIDELRDVDIEEFILFSVVNPMIIPKKYLEDHNVSLAINYHDSLLPRYAGVNSTTWAIYNNESTHGITWHILSAGIDEGGILQQASIEILPTDDALNLNIKCFEAGIEAFERLLPDIEKCKLHVTKQDLDNRSYYGRNYLPDNYGIIKFTDSYTKIDRLVRSLSLGDEQYTNPVASIKLWDGRSAYIVKNVQYIQQDDAISGYVYASSGSKLRIGIKGGILEFTDIFNYDGSKATLEDTLFHESTIISDYNISDDEENILALMKKKEWAYSRLNESKGTDEKSFFDSPLLDRNSEQFSTHITSNTNSIDSIIQKVLLVIYNFSTDNIRIPINHINNSNLTFADTFIERKSIVDLTKELNNLSIKEFIVKIMEDVNKKYQVAKDFGYRYGMDGMVSEVGIFVGDEYAQEHFKQRLNIVISKSRVSFHAYREDQLLIQSLIKSVEHVLTIESINNLDIICSEFQIIPPVEQQLILHDWNKPNEQYSNDQTIYKIFQDNARKNPNEVAIICDGKALTYKVLNEKSNQLARHIRKTYRMSRGKALPSYTLISVCFERSIEMIISLLAVVKAGAAYVPIDTKFPDKRIEYILKDTNSPFLLTQAHLQPQLFRVIENLNNEVLNSDSDQIPTRLIILDEKLYGEEKSTNLRHKNQANDLAYVIYTSGTTGQPKGVMVSHANIISLIYSDFINIESTDCFMFLSSPVFDAATFEIWTPLCRGAQLAIPTDTRELVADPELFKAFIQDHSITILWVTKALFDTMYLTDEKSFSRVNYLLIGGEVLDVDVINKIMTNPHRPTHILNAYGPTESTTFTCVYPINGKPFNSSVPIGKPITNRQVYVLNKMLQPVPIGVVGELYIGGSGLARGYLNRQELTAEKFVDNPYATQEERGCGSDKLYNSGDLVRWQADGNLEFLGRNDSQVKIRGFRIELKEIENALSSYSGVKQVSVLAKEIAANNGKKHHSLISYLVCEQEISDESLIHHLEKYLPDYMIPSTYVKLQSLPLTINGKLDRATLLSINTQIKSRNLIKPSSDIEALILDVWRKVLGSNDISIDDRFFQIGGNSLLAMNMQTLLSDRLGMRVGITNIFQYPTIHSLAKCISQQLGANDSSSTAPAIKESSIRISESESESDHCDIAIIGMACRVPGANTIDELWANLMGGVESIESISDEQLAEVSSQLRDVTNKKYVKRAANIDDYLGFDAGFFGFTPREAQSLDPQHRHFMEIVWEALEDSGYVPGKYAGKIGVYAGQGASDYFLNNIHGNAKVKSDIGDYQIRINNDKDFLSTKVSFKLDLNGPSINIQSACSTSLVSVHLAIQQLVFGDCDVAVAGGVSIEPRYGYKHKEGMIDSPDGICRPFDSNANGTIVSSGVGAVILKPLSKALADGDNIYATIKASAINNDGSNKVGYTAPSVEGQAEVIETALARANINPATISYIEAHGTATKLGDPIELQALHQTFEKYTTQQNSIAIGSIKSNIGHTDTAAGIMGLIKTCLALRHKKIPKTLHFNHWNEEISYFNKIFYVNKSAMEWNVADGVPRRAGVSSFGIGGTNAHLILQEAPELGLSQSSRTNQVFLISAKNGAALQNNLKKLAIFIEENPNADLSNISYTQQVGRMHWDYRKSFVSNERNDLLTQLRSSLESEHDVNECEQQLSIVFMFSGQGSQYVHMGNQAYKYEPVFKEVVDYCCAFLKSKVGIDLLSIFMPSISGSKVTSEQLMQTEYAQPALFIIEYAMSQLFISLGVKVDAMIGHSIGEYVAATIAGIFNLDDALRLVALRGKLMQEMQPGTMLSVALSDVELQKIIPECLDMAAVNGPNLCVVSGDFPEIDEFADHLASMSIKYSKLHTSHAFHSRMMMPLKSSYMELLSKIKKSKPVINIMSNTTGEWLTDEQAMSDIYWFEHLTRPVLFKQGINNITKEYSNACLIEMGPGRTLTSLTKLTDKTANAINTLPHPKQKDDEHTILLTSLGKLWQLGYNLDWQQFNKHENLHRISVPTYAFDHKQYSVGLIDSNQANTYKSSIKYKEDDTVSLDNTSKQQESNDDTLYQMNIIWENILGVGSGKSNSDFFELGGHSLLAIQLIEQISSSFNVELNIQDILDNPGFNDLYTHILRIKDQQNVACAVISNTTNGLEEILI